MKLVINGQIRMLDLEQNPSSIISVLHELGHHPRLVVVELNGLIVPPKSWKDKKVEDGDIIEIVTIVGGGS